MKRRNTSTRGKAREGRREWKVGVRPTCPVVYKALRVGRRGDYVMQRSYFNGVNHAFTVVDGGLASAAVLLYGQLGHRAHARTQDDAYRSTRYV
ncbi:hypothetical protein MRX96_013031 [Rhipicephalus microplus]